MSEPETGARLAPPDKPEAAPQSQDGGGAGAKTEERPIDPRRPYINRSFRFTHQGFLVEATFYRAPGRGVDCDGSSWSEAEDIGTALPFDNIGELTAQRSWTPITAQQFIDRLNKLLHS